MDTAFQALVIGIVQGLTEFLPISSSGHLILVPYLLGWTDPFINSLAFSVMLHMGTLAALLAYFWRDWTRLVPAGLAALRDRSFRGDRDRRLAWLIVATLPPAVVLGVLLSDVFETQVRQPLLVAVMLVAGAAILWLADRLGRKADAIERLGFAGAFAIGCAQALALVPGISRSGISISAGLGLGLQREAATRFSFLMATPVIAGAGLFELRKLLAGEVTTDVNGGAIAIGFVAAVVSGLGAIHVLLRYVRNHPMTAFVAYRLVLAVLVVVTLLAADTARGQGVEVMKQLRQREIRDLVEQRPIRTQQELAAALRERGFRATQATISRDIAELALVKVGREGVAVYAPPARPAEADPTGEERLKRLFRDIPVEFRESGLLLVLVTLPGSAHAIAAALDRARWADAVGTIAGDDTLFIACADRRSLARLRGRLERLAAG